MQENSSKNLIVSCSPTLVKLVEREIKSLGFTPLKVRPSSIVYPFSLEAMYAINYCSRMAQRVLFPLKTFTASNRKELYDVVAQINWSSYLNISDTFAIDSHVANSKGFDNSFFAALVVKDAICDQFREKTKGQRPSVQTLDPSLQLHLHIFKDSATLSLDTSGAPLYRRGYRIGKAKAPLQETLAAALLTLGNFSAKDVLCDPFCGSGTILIEALLMATNTPPGFLRKSWGFERLPEHNVALWNSFKQKKQQEIRPPKSELIGIEKDKKIFHEAVKNIQYLKREKDIRIINSDFADVRLQTRPTLFVTNPPYGKRVGEVEALKDTYEELGQFMQKFGAPKSRGVVLTSQLDLIRAMRLRYLEKIPLDNGPIESGAYLFNLSHPDRVP